MNALLSFLYGLLVHDCSAALTAAGLDPCVGFLHVDRPGRPGLSLDLMEEFRPLLADRVALTLVNRQQVKAEGFEERDGGEVAMREATLRAVLAALPTAEARGTNAPLSRSKGPLRAIALLAGAGAGAVRAELPHEWWTPG
jgi:CRISPR-associated protein Cas1